ncbi:MAG: NADH-ubiquinone oxidoreductase chain N [uncultured Rubrobacteraceae bacterium]|uniref:NADH-quinone oxidoreductase subunit N n=1 Tax=uncultured Rubrobacteraceae bacterium TaxID=349277 RepID=A0A6J4QPJ0_9ACTN|nr:MAG: NADH-ubiquinone oxidoreductase chain N [uncultured Rubrobacteraceae bacterium]
MTGQAFIALLPELISTGFLILVLMVGVFSDSNVGISASLAAIGTLAVFASAAVLLASGFSGSFFGDGFVVDGFALYFKLIVAGSAFFAVLAAARWADQTGDAPEYLTLILSVVLGSTLLVSMRDLFGIFLAIELATIPSYAMVAFDRSRRESAEGGMKYLITGVIASSVLLYGIVLIYGVSGSAMLSDVADTFTGTLTPVAVLGLVLMVSGFAFKLSAAPFHFWTPDAYQGAPTSAAAFLSVGPKAATFAILLRILLEGMPGAAPTWTAVMAFLAIITMFVGNLFALRQRNVRRMLAYSSVAHSGYILAAFAALQGGGVAFAVQAVLIYTAAYAVMNMGAFLVIDLVGEDAKSFNGLVRTNPGVAASMALFMAALVGIPPLSGFFGKLWIIIAGAPTGSILVYIVVGALVVNTVLSVPYYFGIIRNMLFEEPTTDTVTSKGSGAVRFSVYVLAVLTTLFGLLIIPLSALVGASGLA